MYEYPSIISSANMYGYSYILRWYMHKQDVVYDLKLKKILTKEKCIMNVKKKVKDLRIIMCLGIIIAGFLPWFEVLTTVKVWGVGSEASTKLTVFQSFEHSFLGVFIILLPVAFLAINLFPKFNIKLSPIYLIGSIVGFVASILAMIFCKSAVVNVQASGSGVDMEVKTKLHIGFWLILILYIVIFVFTLVKDYSFNKASLGSSGIKGIISSVVNDVKNPIVKSGAEIVVSNEVNVCPSCGADVAKGKKFCAKCGAKIVKVEEKPSIPKEIASIEKINIQKNITVNEYIQSLKVVTCDKCNTKVSTNNKFCPECGEQIKVRIIFDKCNQCGGEIIKDKKFCPDCGAAVEEKELKTNCTSCNAELLFGKKYCVECGTKVE